MTTIVIMPGGFHPFHAGHFALYQSAQKAFPKAEVFVAATNDTSTRPFPFPVKEKLAKLAGVEAGHFVQVKSPFRAEEITSRFNPEKDVLVFVRSEKDSTKPPQAGGVKKDGSPSYLQPLQGQTRYEPFAKHAYMAYLPTVEFGPGMTSATEIRGAWPTLNEKRKTALVMSLYPKTQGNLKLAATVVGLLDVAIGGEQGVAEGLDEAVGGNYLYHATSAGGLKGMLSSGSIRSATGPQAATSAQTTLPTVSVTRDWGYASGAQAQSQLGGIGRDAILVLDRNAVESNFKTLGTSQSTNIKGLAFNPYLKKDGAARSQNTDPMARTNAKAKAKYAEPTAKAGGEFEEAVVVPKGALPLKGTMVGFWINPKSELMQDPSIMNDPRRLDMPRPNQFVKAAQPQAVEEGWKEKVGAAALASGMALGGLSHMGNTTATNWDQLPQQMSTRQDTGGNEKIMSVTGPNNKGEYRVRVTTDNDVQEFITKTPPRSLNEFAPGAGDEGGGEDPYKYPKPKRYARSADYFGQFEADHFDREDFDDATGVFKGYWGRTPIAYFKFDNPARTGGDDPGMGWYYEPESDGNGNNTGAAPAVDRPDGRKQQELGMIDAFLKSGNRPSPGSQIYQLMKKHGLAENVAEAAKKCPLATQDIGINLENRQKAIDEYGYGPLNPDLPNTKFWMKKVDEWNLDSMEEAQQSLCGNCAAFDIRQDTLDCIAQGIDSDSPEDAAGVIDAGDLGYCKFLKFKCASRRTCDAWVTGGPLQDKPIDENQGQSKPARQRVAGDAELTQAKAFARTHYPGMAADPDTAFDKWVQRSLMHSNKDDREQNTDIARLAKEISLVKSKLQTLQKNIDSSDYLDE